MPTLSVDGAELYYDVRGQGAPLLLVAGLAFDSTSWAAITPALERRFQLIALDNRGAGRTRPLEAATSVATMADDCIALLDHLGVDTAHVLGHSMGGFVAQELAIRRPCRVGRVVLAATAPTNLARNNLMFADWARDLEGGADLAQWFRNIYYWTFSPRFFNQSRVVEAAVEFALRHPYPQTPRAFRHQIEAVAAFDATPHLGAIKAPTLVLAAGQDLLFPAGGAEQFAAKIPGATFAMLDDAGHSLHLEMPAAFAAEALAFLARE